MEEYIEEMINEYFVFVAIHLKLYYLHASTRMWTLWRNLNFHRICIDKWSECEGFNKISIERSSWKRTHYTFNETITFSPTHFSNFTHLGRTSIKQIRSNKTYHNIFQTQLFLTCVKSIWNCCIACIYRGSHCTQEFALFGWYFAMSIAYIYT